MQRHQILGNFLVSGLVVSISAQTVQAAPLQITTIRINPTSNGIDLVLAPSDGAVSQGGATGDRPQVFTLSQGNTWVADLTNTQLLLPGQSQIFRQDNPAPGIASISVTPSSSSSIRVTVTGQTGSPAGQVTPQERGGFIFSLIRTIDRTPPTPTPALPPTSTLTTNPADRVTYSDQNVAPAMVDLGTSVRIQRVVLRETAVREVLALLARTADLGIVYTEDLAAGAGAGAQAGGSPIDSLISLELENESVQDVFNYVLQAKGLRANRVGKTVFVGQNLPATTGNYIARTLRLNQMRATLPPTNLTRTVTSNSSLTSGGGGQGAGTTNSQVGRSSTLTENEPLKGALQILEELGANATTAATRSQAFKGLQVTADSRTNTVTLLGTPPLVQSATDYLAKLDVRRKQVAVNVKIIEVNLTNSNSMSSSFSFGVTDSFFTVNQGQITANFGSFNPSLAADPNSLTGRTTIVAPNVGIPVFQFPRQFLLRLQAQITSGNAKVLTDPTLIVQEGSQSQVNLTSQAFAGFTSQDVTTGNTTTTRTLPLPPIDVGVILNVQIDKIDENNFITLSVSPEVSSLGQAITDPSRNNLLIQQLVNRRRLETGSIRLRDGQTLLLTGIIQDQDRLTISKVPILGDIPLINLLFRSRTRSKERNEVIVLVTPRVLDDYSNIPYGNDYVPGADMQRLLQQGNPPRKDSVSPKTSGQ